IERELVAERGFAAAVPVLGDVGNRAKLHQVFERYRPGVVFHAAAYKHVALMEANPLEAVRNNALVTKTIAEVAVEHGVQRYLPHTPYALRLVMQRQASGDTGDVFVLYKADRVHVDDLARNMVWLQGKVPGRDVMIEYRGARPGEKLHQELSSTGEVVTQTA